MTERIVRITRTWDVVVVAEYGDDESTLIAKATPGTVAEAAVTTNLLPKAV